MKLVAKYFTKFVLISLIFLIAITIGSSLYLGINYYTDKDNFGSRNRSSICYVNYDTDSFVTQLWKELFAAITGRCNAGID